MKLRRNVITNCWNACLRPACRATGSLSGNRIIETCTRSVSSRTAGISGRNVRTSFNVEIYRQIREHMEKVNLHPAIVKKASFVKYVNWYKKTVTYIPYYFEYGGKIYFLKNLATRTGSEFGDRRERNEMAALLRNLRGNRYEYCTFYSQKKDIFEFFDWLRKNKYTLEIQGDLFDFADDRSHVDFHGNVCEYSAVFHYRIYSRKLFGHIINQLRTVKRYHAWHKRREIR